MALLARARSGLPGAILVTGEPGIGKSTLLAQLGKGLPDALVLHAAGAEHEMGLPLAMLGQLLFPIRRSFALMEEHHRRVLVAAIEHGEPATPTVVGLAVLDLLGALSERHDLTVVILDDVQWMDRLSESALLFAVRRLHGERVATLLAARTGETDRFGGLETIELDGLDDDDCRSVLSASGEVTAEVARLARRASGGNPFVLRQLGAVLSARQRNGIDPLPDAVPIGPVLAAQLQRRIAGLDDRARSALIILAAAGSGDRQSVDDAWSTLGVSSDDLHDVEMSDVIAQGPEGYDFTHPLMRSAVIDSVEPWVLRAAHRTLAGVLPTSSIDRKAHHLDLAADGPDDEAAEALAGAATRANGLGAHEVAAVAWERAARRTLDASSRAHRLGEAGISWWRAHRPERGIGLCREAVDELGMCEDSAPIMFALGDMVAFYDDTREGAQMLVDSALVLGDEAPGPAATMMSQAANLCALSGDLRRGVHYTRVAEAMAASADSLTQIGCDAIATHLRVIHGDVLDVGEGLANLEALGRLIGPGAPESLVRLGQLIVFDWMSLGRFDAADDLATRVIALGRAEGLRGVETFVHGLRGEVAWRRGRWIEARAEALFEVHFTEDEREDQGGSFAHATLARVEAAMGLVAESTRNADLVVERGALIGMGVLESWGRHARGLAALAAGAPESALPDLEWIWDLCRRGEIGEPGPLWWHGDLVEAYWRVGRIGDGRRLVEYLQHRADATGSEWAAAIVARGRGLFDRDVDDLVRSARRLDALGAPFEAARSRALIGEVAPGTCTTELSAAFDTFVGLGARPWAERTAVMLGRHDDAPVGPLALLTKAELRVAAAVARGMSNRDAADTLFLSPKTVDAHLQRIYRKLGVTSRTELAVLIGSVAVPNGRGER